jgi:O-antigen/teichoic acid export membrane protein
VLIGRRDRRRTIIKMSVEPTQSDDPATLTHRILAGARWATVLQLLGQVVSWLSTIIVVRFLTPQDYGLYSMLEAPLELLLLVAILGMDVALVRAQFVQQAALRAAFGLLLVVGAVLFSAFYFGAGWIAEYYRQDALVAAAQTLSFIFLILPFRVIPNAMLDRNLQFKSRAQLELVSKVASAVVTLALAMLGAGFWALIVGFLADRLFYAVLVSIRHPWFTMPSFRIDEARALIVFGGVNTAASAVQLVTSKGVGMIIAPILGAAQLGVYSLATQFALMPLAKAMPILSRLLVPAFAQFASRPDTAAQHLEQAIRIAAVVLAPFMIGMAALSGPFVELVFGPAWTDAALPLALMSCVMPLRLSTLFIRLAITSIGSASLLLQSVMVPFVLALPLSYFVAPYGMVAVIWLWMAIEPLTLVVVVVLAQRALPFTFGALARALRPAAVAAAMLAAAVYASQWFIGEVAGSLWPLVAGVVVGGAAYVGALFLLFRPTLMKTCSVILGR